MCCPTLSHSPFEGNLGGFQAGVLQTKLLRNKFLADKSLCENKSLVLWAKCSCWALGKFIFNLGRKWFYFEDRATGSPNRLVVGVREKTGVGEGLEGTDTLRAVLGHGVGSRRLDSSYAIDSKQQHDVWGNEKTRETPEATGTRESVRGQLVHGKPFDYLLVSKVKEGNSAFSCDAERHKRMSLPF